MQQCRAQCDRATLGDPAWLKSWAENRAACGLPRLLTLHPASYASRPAWHAAVNSPITQQYSPCGANQLVGPCRCRRHWSAGAPGLHVLHTGQR